jgi:hypothetical protein
VAPQPVQDDIVYIGFMEALQRGEKGNLREAPNNRLLVALFRVLNGLRFGKLMKLFKGRKAKRSAQALHWTVRCVFLS